MKTLITAFFIVLATCAVGQSFDTGWDLHKKNLVIRGAVEVAKDTTALPEDSIVAFHMDNFYSIMQAHRGRFAKMRIQNDSVYIHYPKAEKIELSPPGCGCRCHGWRPQYREWTAEELKKRTRFEYF